MMANSTKIMHNNINLFVAILQWKKKEKYQLLYWIKQNGNVL